MADWTAWRYEPHETCQVRPTLRSHTAMWFVRLGISAAVSPLFACRWTGYDDWAGVGRSRDGPERGRHRREL